MVNRNEIIAQTLRALASTSEFEDASLDYETLDEIHTRLENLPKDDPNKIRKRSAARDTKSPVDGPKRIRGGYQVCDHKEHGSDEFRARVKKHMGENPEKKYMSAKGDVWKMLTNEEQEVYEKKANELNEANGFAAKEAKKASPTVTKSQMEEQNRLLVEELRKANLEIPDMPEREPPKPRKKKKSPSSSEEPVESPPDSPVVNSAPEENSGDVDNLATMVSSITLVESDDDDSDDEEDAPAVVGDAHKEWCKTTIKDAIEFDPNFSKSTADFHAWVMYQHPETYGEGKQSRVENLKEMKKQHNYKAMKDDPAREWANFLA